MPQPGWQPGLEKEIGNISHRTHFRRTAACFRTTKDSKPSAVITQVLGIVTAMRDITGLSAPALCRQAHMKARPRALPPIDPSPILTKSMISGSYLCGENLTTTPRCRSFRRAWTLKTISLRMAAASLERRQGIPVQAPGQCHFGPGHHPVGKMIARGVV